MISKYKFEQRYFDNPDFGSIITGIITIEHNLSEDELVKILDENGIQLDNIDDILYYDIEYPNAFSEIKFQKI